MSSGPLDPELAAALEDAMTMTGAPSLIEDHTRPDIGPVAVLTVAPSISVHTSDERVGAELVDLIVATLLRWGFDLVTAVEPAELVALPLLPDWPVKLDATGRLLEIQEPGGVFYDGDLGSSPPPGWPQALRHRGQLVALVGTALTLERDDRFDQIRAASQAGRIVGARLPLT